MKQRFSSLINKRTIHHVMNPKKKFTAAQYTENEQALGKAAYQLLHQKKKLQARKQSHTINILVQAYFGNPSDVGARDKALGFIALLAKQSVVKFNVINMILHSDDKTVNAIAQKFVHHSSHDSTRAKSKSKSTKSKVKDNKNHKVIK